jgi:DNA polymerase II large subunit
MCTFAKVSEIMLCIERDKSKRVQTLGNVDKVKTRVNVTQEIKAMKICTVCETGLKANCNE